MACILRVSAAGKTTELWHNKGGQHARRNDLYPHRSDRAS